jgi:hypothetical protein
VLVPLTWGLVVRRVPQWGVAVSIVTGLVASSAIKFSPELFGSSPWLYHEQVFTVFAAGTVALFLSRFAWRPGDARQTALEQEFFARRDRPVDFAREVGGASDQRQMKVVGLFGLAIGGSILLLLIPTSSAGHAIEIVVTAASTCVIGALFLRAWRRSRTDGATMAGAPDEAPAADAVDAR